MKTYRISTVKEMEQFKDDYGYKVDGNLEVECSLDLKGRLLVEGFIEAGESIKAGGSIKAGYFIKAGGYIEAGGFIKAGESIEARYYIKAGYSYGISAGLQITCKGVLKYGLKCFAGICTWRTISDTEKIITCGKHEGGVIEYGILRETGIEAKPETMITINGKEWSASTIQKALREYIGD